MGWDRSGKGPLTCDKSRPESPRILTVTASRLAAGRSCPVCLSAVHRSCRSCASVRARWLTFLARRSVLSRQATLAKKTSVVPARVTAAAPLARVRFALALLICLYRTNAVLVRAITQHTTPVASLQTRPLHRNAVTPPSFVASALLHVNGGCVTISLYEKDVVRRGAEPEAEQ